MDSRKRARYVPRHEMVEDRSIARMLAPSVLGIIVCMMCLIGLTLAWFSSAVQNASRLDAPLFAQQMTVRGPDSVNVRPSDGGSYQLSGGSTYHVTVQPASYGPKNPSGYVTVRIGEQTWFTEPFRHNEGFQFSVEVPDGGVAMTLTACWGYYDGREVPNPVENGGTVRPDSTEQPADDGGAPEAGPPSSDEPLTDDPAREEPGSGLNPDGTYTVREGDVLSAIAERFGTTAEKLAAYNGIENPDYITGGQILKIPPKDYVVPVSPEQSDEPPVSSDAPGDGPEESAEPGAVSRPDETPGGEAPEGSEEPAAPGAGEDSGGEPSGGAPESGGPVEPENA